jgi:hypothetical protein
VLAPIVAGYLFQGGADLPSVSMVMAFGSLLAAGTLLFLKLKPDEPKADTEGEEAPDLKRATAS